MKKMLILGAMALALSANAAMAAKMKSKSVTLDGFCDTFTVTSDGTAAGLNSTGTGCDDGFGQGYVGKVKGHGKLANVGAVLGGDPSSVWSIAFSYPLVTGGSFYFGFTQDGITLYSDVLTGTYTVNDTADTRAPKGLKPITLVFKK